MRKKTVSIDTASLDETINVLDLFSGAGGLSLGIQDLSEKFELIGAIDYSDVAIQTLNKNHSEDVGVSADLSSYTPEEYAKEHNISPSDVDVICGGPPCKGFSSIRPNKSNGRDDRNYLYQFYFNFVEYFEPDVFVMENVPRLENHTNESGKRIFKAVQSRATDIGYTHDYQILNAAHYGVPQRRNRLFFVGSLESQPIKFPEPKFLLPSGLRSKNKGKLLPSNWDNPRARNIECVIKDLPALNPGQQKEEYFCEPERLNEPERHYVEEYLRRENPDLTHHKASGNNEEMQKRISFAGETRDELPDYIFPNSGYSSTYSRLRREEPSSTITTGFTSASSTRCIHPYENRAISLREGARIQSFPDDFEFVGNKTEIASQIGNAVPPLLGKAVGATVADLLN